MVPAKTAEVVDLDRWDVQRARGGDLAAAGRLYRRHRQQVWNLARLVCGNAEDAEDVCQDAFLRALRGLDGFRGEARFSSWLYRITVNQARNHHASAGRRRAAVGDLQEARIVESPARGGGAELRAALAQAVHRLTEGQLEVLTCHDVLGMSHQETAYVLDCAEGTSKAQLHKARMRLRKILKGA